MAKKLRLFGGTDPSKVAGESPDSIAVIGLGRFGRSLALELMKTGAEVLGIDNREHIVQDLNGKLTHVVRADATNEEVLHQLAIPEFTRVVVAIGSDIQASVLVTSMLLNFGIDQIWAKAVTDAHGTILKQLGVEHVVYPEKDMGKRLAHLVRGSILDYIEISPEFALIKTKPHAEIIGRPIGQLEALRRSPIRIVSVSHGDQPWEHATDSTVLTAADRIVISGPTRLVEKFASSV